MLLCEKGYNEKEERLALPPINCGPSSQSWFI